MPGKISRVFRVRCPIEGKYVSAFALLCCGMLFFSVGSLLAGSTSQDELVRRLRHEAERVRSAKCEFDLLLGPTEERMIPLIQDIARAKNKPLKQYLHTETLAKKRSVKVRWWRAGERERYESTPLDPSSGGTTKVQTFDGQTVRAFERHPDGHIVGSVDTLESSHWNAMNRLHPFSILYTHVYAPYWEIVANGGNFQLESEVRGGEEVTRVSIDHPIHRGRTFLMWFDDSDRLIERHIIAQIGEPNPRLYQIQTFEDYQPFPSRYGEPVWFPKRTVIRGVVGIHPNGTPVVTKTTTVVIRELEFNVDIPDETFRLEFDEDARIYDGLTGTGWLERGERPELLFPEVAERRKRYWVWGISLAVAVLLGLAGWFYYRHRKRLQAS